MEIIVGKYYYLTKVHLLALKEKLDLEFTYVRDEFDYLLISKDKNATVKITHDGLIYLRSKGELEDVPYLVDWLEKMIIKKIKLLDEEDEFFENLLVEKNPLILLLNPKEKIGKIFETLERKYDYNLKTKILQKDYGNGLVIYNNIKINREELDQLIEYQIIFAEYQNLMKEVLKYNRDVWNTISDIRKEERWKIKDLPPIIDELLDKKRKNTFVLKRVMQIKEFLGQRKEKCRIVSLLKEIKMDDFGEMMRLNNYVTDQFSMTNDYISSTMSLIEYIYKENEQNQMNILQIIFAIGTIATCIQLSQISDDTLVLHTPSGNIIGDLITYDFPGMIWLTVISIVIGIALFAALNFFYMQRKRVNINRLLKDSRI